MAFAAEARPSSCAHLDAAATSGSCSTGPVLLQTQKQVHRILKEDTNRKVSSKLLLLSGHDVVYNHLPKAAGTFVKSVLQKVMPQKELLIESEFDSITKADREQAFTIGSIRNPCNYYVSLWAFGSIGKGTLRSYHGATIPDSYYGVTKSLNTSEDVRRFSAWLRYIMPHGKPGLESARLAFSYVHERVPQQFGNFAGPESLRNASLASLHNLLQSTIDKFDPSSVNCWIRVENVKDDLKRCLQAFEKSTGASLVDWESFTQAVSSKENENNSQHQPCKFYYADANGTLTGNEAFIRSSDKAIFEKFGYDTCCAPSQQ